MYTTDVSELHQMANAELIREYIHAGNGQLTLVAPSTKSHKYLFMKPKEREKFPDDTIFVYVLHNDKRMYVGMLEGDSFRLTKNSRFEFDTEAAKGAEYIVKMSNSQQLCDDTPMNLYHSGVCAKCGRSLTGFAPNVRGIGKKCYYKLRRYNDYFKELPDCKFEHVPYPKKLRRSTIPDNISDCVQVTLESLNNVGTAE